MKKKVSSSSTERNGPTTFMPISSCAGIDRVRKISRNSGRLPGLSLYVRISTSTPILRLLSPGCRFRRLWFVVQSVASRCTGGFFHGQSSSSFRGHGQRREGAAEVLLRRLRLEARHEQSRRGRGGEG